MHPEPTDGKKFPFWNVWVWETFREHVIDRFLFCSAHFRGSMFKWYGVQNIRLSASGVCLNGYFLCSSRRVEEMYLISSKCKGQDSLQTESAGLLHCRQHLLVQHGEGGIRGEIQAIETCVSPTKTNKDTFHFLTIYISIHTIFKCLYYELPDCAILWITLGMTCGNPPPTHPRFLYLA